MIRPATIDLHKLVALPSDYNVELTLFLRIFLQLVS